MRRPHYERKSRNHHHLVHHLPQLHQYKMSKTNTFAYSPTLEKTLLRLASPRARLPQPLQTKILSAHL